MREKQPRLLVIWGMFDLSFGTGEPERHRKDVPTADRSSSTFSTLAILH